MASGTEKEPLAEGVSTRLPGEPVPEDELDPELIALPRTRPTVGPLLSLSVICLCGLLLFKLWPDFRFARHDQPENFDSTADLLQRGEANAFVAVRAVPDLSTGAVVRRGKGDYGHRLQPVFGTSGRLWVMTHSFHWHATPAYSQVFLGRLAVLGDLPFYDDLKDDWRKREPTSRVVDVPILEAALRSGAKQLEVVGGDTVPLTPETVFEIAQTVPEKVSVTAYITDDRPDEATWKLALEQAGLEIVGGRAQGQGQSGETILFEIQHPGGVLAVREIFAQKRMFAARAEPVLRDHHTTAGALRASERGLELQDGELLPWSSIDLARVAAAYPMDANARVIIATDRPEDYWYVASVVTLLLASMAFFAFVLLRTLWRAWRTR